MKTFVVLLKDGDCYGCTNPIGEKELEYDMPHLKMYDKAIVLDMEKFMDYSSKTLYIPGVYYVEEESE